MSDNDTVLDYDPLEDDVEMAQEVNDALSVDASASEVGGARVVEILQHSWYQGELKLKVKWTTEEETWERFRDMKEDHPKMTAQYMVENQVTRSTRSDRNLQWATKTVRDMRRAVRRVARLYDFVLDDNEDVCKIRRAQQGGQLQQASFPVWCASSQDGSTGARA